MGMRARLLTSVIVVAAFALAACGGGESGSSSTGSTTPGPTSGVTGMVLAGPVCPVLQDPPDPACAERPVQGAVIVVTGADGAEMAVVSSDKAGRFAIALPPGSYRLTPQTVAGLLGTAAPTDVVVIPGETIDLFFLYDTGIR